MLAQEGELFATSIYALVLSFCLHAYFALCFDAFWPQAVA